MRTVGVTVEAHAGDTGIELHLTMHTLFGALAVACASMLAGDMAACDGCGTPYPITEGMRRPKRRQHSFCPACREGGRASKRLWAAERRALTPIDANPDANPGG